jgi:hypothetical protein
VTDYDIPIYLGLGLPASTRLATYSSTELFDDSLIHGATHLAALILPVSFFIGSTQMGWSIGGSACHTLTIGSALTP